MAAKHATSAISVALYKVVILLSLRMKSETRATEKHCLALFTFTYVVQGCAVVKVFKLFFFPVEHRNTHFEECSSRRGRCRQWVLKFPGKILQQKLQLRGLKLKDCCLLKNKTERKKCKFIAPLLLLRKNLNTINTYKPLCSCQNPRQHETAIRISKCQMPLDPAPCDVRKKEVTVVTLHSMHSVVYTEQSTVHNLSYTTHIAPARNAFLGTVETFRA